MDDLMKKTKFADSGGKFASIGLKSSSEEWIEVSRELEKRR